MMQPEQGIGRELSLGEVISKTFEVYRRDFAKYFVLFAVVGVIVQVVTTLAQQAFVLPILPVNPTPQQFSTWFSALFAAFFLLIAVIFVVNIVFSTIAEGSAVKLASEQITKGQVNLGASVMAQDLRNLPRPRNNPPSRLVYCECDKRVSRHPRSGGQRHPLSTLSTTIPDTNGRLLLLQSCKNLTASSRPDAHGTTSDVPGWNEALPHLRYTESLLSHFLHKMRGQAQLTTASSSVL